MSVAVGQACAEEESYRPSLGVVVSHREIEWEAGKAALPSTAFTWSFNLNCVKEKMLVFLSSVSVTHQNESMPMWASWDCPEDQAPVTTLQETIQIKYNAVNTPASPLKLN